MGETQEVSRAHQLADGADLGKQPVWRIMVAAEAEPHGCALRSQSAECSATCTLSRAAQLTQASQTQALTLRDGARAKLAYVRTRRTNEREHAL